MKIIVNKIARKIEVDNRFPLLHYYRIADNLLRQASIHREENNLVDLFIILLRFSSLVSDTIPYHKDYQALLPKERTVYRKKLINVVDELEALKPEFDRLVEERNRAYDRLQLNEHDESASTSYYTGTPSLKRPSANRISYTGVDTKKPADVSSQSLGKCDDNHYQVSFPNSQIDKQFNKLSINLPIPKQETLSRHSILGPSGLQGQWLGPSAEVKVQYPCYTDLPSTEISGLNQAVQSGTQATTNDGSGSMASTMDSVLSLDDGRWSLPVDDAISIRRNEAREDPFHFVGIRQPPPPPVLAQVRHEFSPIPPSRVADPRPGAAKSSQNGMPSSNSYQHLHVPLNLMEGFLRLAQKNTEKNLETCGVLAGSLKNKIFHITTLIIPKQESTSDSCQTLNEEEIFEVQDKLSLFPLGWIHTHPSQTCFMSSVDLHTHYSYQIMLPEAVAIVMAPTDEQSPHGIFHLSDPSGVSVIRNCQQRGFHPHEEPVDGSPIYEHCSHVYMNSKSRYDVVDLR